jgi:predicted small secreted protein
LPFDKLFHTKPNHLNLNSTQTHLMTTSPTRIALLLFLTALFVVAGTSCRTVRGAGQDIQHVGSHIEHAANEHDHR